jgi:hypothetical protein
LSAGQRVPQLAGGVTRRPLFGRVWRVLSSTWTLGILAAIGSWNLLFIGPFGGLDPSWWSGLYMAADSRMDFGTEIVFTFGPLGFLKLPWLWYGDLAALGFVYAGVLRIALAVSLVWALRRTLGAAASLALGFLILVIASSAEAPMLLAAIWCLAALSPTPPGFARPLVVLGGSLLGAIETLALLRSGPVILAMCAITVSATERWRRELPLFIACSGVFIVGLWFAAGQRLAALPEFIRTAYETLSGYSEAMGVRSSSELHLPVIVALAVALIAAATYTSATGRKRLAAAGVTGLAAFLLYKGAVVRAEPGHEAVFFATVLGLGASLAFGSRRLLMVGAIVVLGAFALVFPTTGRPPVDFNPITHAREAGQQLRMLLSPARRNRVTRDARTLMAAVYGLRRSMLSLLRGHTVHVDPWETALVWTYRLDWDPLPVFQDVTNYTSELDRLSAKALRSSDGPERILQENTARGASGYKTAAVDSRYPAWDPPAQSLAMLCNYVPLQTTARWQVLGKVRDRCGVPKRIASTSAQWGETVSIPPAEPRGVVFARIHGAGVSGLERLRTFAYRASFRYVVVNGATTYRLVPGTATDGLLMGAAPGVDYPAPFTLAPDARTIELKGRAGELQVELYRMPVRTTRTGDRGLRAAPRSAAPRG